jgi:endonuclease-3
LTSRAGRPARPPSSPWKRPTARRVRAIRDRLRAVYGVPLAPPHGHPIAELILTVLSQSTNDRNRDVAFLRLRDRFAAWEDVRDAPVSEIEEAIRPGGISKVKSVRIQAILRAITDTSPESDLPGCSPPDELPRDLRLPGSKVIRRTTEGPQARSAPLSLDWLPELSVPEAQAYLCSLPGVGRKTAACVLLFTFGMRDVPVDTHVSRVGTRLGLFRAGAPFEELHDQMLTITPPGEELELHINLLRHGRRTCHARGPECSACPLRRMCPSAGEFINLL